MVAAGNRAADQALARPLSSALVNRLLVVHVRVDAAAWHRWAEANRVRGEVRAFLGCVPQALCRPAARDPVPFSTPRAWALLGRDLDLAEAGGRLTPDERRAVAFGRVSPEDAGLFCALAEGGLADLPPLEAYLADPARLPTREVALWFLVSRLRRAVERGELWGLAPDDDRPGRVHALLAALPQEYRFAALLDLVDRWADLGASAAMLDTLREVTGL